MNVPGEYANSLGLSVKEACERISIGRTTFYKLVKAGLIPVHKCGRRSIILPNELQQAVMSLPYLGSQA